MNLTTKQATQNIFSGLNWKIYPSTLFSIITLLLMLPCILFLPRKYAWENSFIENLQLSIILILFVITLKIKQRKNLFNWVGMIAIILFLREISCGRIFFPLNNVEAPIFKQWNQIFPYPYNYIPNTLLDLFIIYAIYYFFKSKVYLQLFEILKYKKIDCLNILFIILGISFNIVGEKILHSEMVEETGETLFYVSFTTLIFLYGFNKDYK